MPAKEDVGKVSEVLVRFGCLKEFFVGKYPQHGGQGNVFVRRLIGLLRRNNRVVFEWDVGYVTLDQLFRGAPVIWGDQSTDVFHLVVGGRRWFKGG